jgi:hypothetical protein
VKVTDNAAPNQTVSVINTTTSREDFRLKGFRGSQVIPGFSNRGDRIITASNDNQTIIWDAGDGGQMLSIDGISLYSSFSPDDTKLVTSGFSYVRIWPMNRSAAKRMTFFRENQWVADELYDSAVTNDRAAWTWQAKHYLTPNVVNSGEVQDVLSRIAGQQGGWFQEQALPLINHLNASFYQDWASWHAQNEQYELALADLQHDLTHSKDSFLTWREISLISGILNKGSLHKEAIDRVLSVALNPRTSPADVLTAAVTCRTFPNDLANYDSLMGALARAQKEDPKSFQHVATPGIILYRAGRLDEAEKALTPIAGGTSPNPAAQVCLAMLFARRGDIDSAKHLVAAAEDWFKANLLASWEQQVELRALIKEAREIIDRSGAQKP